MNKEKEIEILTQITQDFNELAKKLLDIMNKEYLLMQGESSNKGTLYRIWQSTRLIGDYMDESVKELYPMLFECIKNKEEKK